MGCWFWLSVGVGNMVWKGLRLKERLGDPLGFRGGLKGRGG